MLKRDVATGVRKLVIVACATLAAPVSSCASSATRPPPSTAIDVLHDYSRALSDGEYQTAYALMSPEYRKRVRFEDWQKNVADNPQEVSEASRRLGRVRDAADILALQRSSSLPLQLATIDGRFFIASEPIELYDQSTPNA